MNEKGKVLIKVENFTAKYGDTVIIDNISFDVYQGEIFVILGGSGCGKSTLLKHMIGLYKPAQGNIIINGEDITKAEGLERRHSFGWKMHIPYWRWRDTTYYPNLGRGKATSSLDLPPAGGCHSALALQS